MIQPQTKTLKVRVHDRHAPLLRRMSRDVNFVWNYCNETSRTAWLRDHRWLGAYDFSPLLAGSCSVLEHIGSAVIDEVRDVHAKCRRQFDKCKLAWRVSDRESPKFSLGWVPFKSRAARWVNGQVRFQGHTFKVRDSHGLSAHQFRAGSFVEDCRGRWHFCVTVRFVPKASAKLGGQPVGVDLGLKEAAVASNGERCPSGRYRELEAKLGIAQRAGRKDRVKAIHQKIKNKRKDDQHKFSRRVVDRAGHVKVGNVHFKTAKALSAKSAHDASWSQLKAMLEWKCRWAGIAFEEVNEAWSTQTCSSCGGIPPESPKGRASLGVRRWKCGICGTEHERDLNAAINIAAAGGAVQ